MGSGSKTCSPLKLCSERSKKSTGARYPEIATENGPPPMITITPNEIPVGNAVV